jgi:hypothetical protein
VAALLQELKQIFGLIDIQDLKGTLPHYEAAVAALVRQYGRASAGIAARFYSQAREEAHVKSVFTPHHAELPSLSEVKSNVRWATKSLWSQEPDIKSARTLLDGAVDQMVLGVGRDTIVDNVHRDRDARGWARVPEAGCCAFCAMLATRGAVYKNEQTADFQAHDGDRCHVEPIFTAYEPSAQVREWQALWSSSTQGHNGKDAINAFRNALGHN